MNTSDLFTLEAQDLPKSPSYFWVGATSETLDPNKQEVPLVVQPSKNPQTLQGGRPLETSRNPRVLKRLRLPLYPRPSVTWRNWPAEMEDAWLTSTRLHCQYHQRLSHHPCQLWLGGSGRMPLSVKSTLGETQISFWDHRTCWTIQFVPQGFAHKDSSSIS